MYFLAEEFAFRELELEFSSKISRGMTLDARTRIQIDGLMPVPSHRKAYAIEVKMILNNDYDRSLKSGLNHLDEIGKAYPTELLLALVLLPGVSNEVRQSLRSEASRMLKSRTPPVTLRIYDFEEMEQRYGISQVSSQ